MFGDEEIREIIPAVSEFKTMGLNVEEPVAPDTVFLRCYKEEYELSRGRVAEYWMHLIGFTVLFAALAVITLEFIDKDKR